MNWISLTSLEQLNTIKRDTNSHFYGIFKHSTRCGISRMVLKNFEKNFDIPSTELTMYYLDLLNYRPISNAIEADFNITHQSPQLLLIKNGVVVSHASHGDITVEYLKKQL